MLGQATRFAAVGLEMGLAVTIGIFGGRYLDGIWETKPTFVLIGLGLGVAAAGKALLDAARRARKTMEDNGPSQPKKN